MTGSQRPARQPAGNLSVIAGAERNGRDVFPSAAKERPQAVKRHTPHQLAQNRAVRGRSSLNIVATERRLSRQRTYGVSRQTPEMPAARQTSMTTTSR